FLMLSFNQLSHACPLQEENIPLHSCNLQGLHRQQTTFAAFPLSLQNGKRFAIFLLVKFLHPLYICKKIDLVEVYFYP
ncbi:hypothetical protein, partial [Dialister histaminiformans]|uniref:hypothetical protein n=1 Tax=Allisonella histaminiformans TaxID=209880 RepID=UPI001F2C7B16